MKVIFGYLAGWTIKSVRYVSSSYKSYAQYSRHDGDDLRFPAHALVGAAGGSART